jgi:hypothetical protein
MPAVQEVKMLIAILNAVGVEFSEQLLQLQLLAAADALLFHGSCPLELLNHTAGCARVPACCIL